MRRFAPQRAPKSVSIPLACSLTLLALAMFSPPALNVSVGFEAASILTPAIALAAAEPPASADERLPAASGLRAIPLEVPAAVVAPARPAPAPPTAAEAKPKTSEARLRIPSIGVDAVVKEMGYTADGAMAVPGNRFEVGWFEPGTRPGDVGSAVIGGHNDWTGGAGVFAHLDRLVPGDILSLVDAKGVTVSFVVRGARTFDANDPDSGIFESASGAHLNLITCSGVWNPTTRSYATRLVVFSDLLPTPAP